MGTWNYERSIAPFDTWAWFQFEYGKACNTVHAMAIVLSRYRNANYDDVIVKLYK